MAFGQKNSFQIQKSEQKLVDWIYPFLLSVAPCRILLSLRLFNNRSYFSFLIAAPSVQTGQEHWKELCYGLIAALVIVTLCAVLYVVISQVLRRRRLRKNASPLHSKSGLSLT